MDLEMHFHKLVKEYTANNFVAKEIPKKQHPTRGPLKQKRLFIK